MRTSTAMSQPDDSSSIRTFFSLSEVEQSKHPLEIRFYVYRADENVNIQWPYQETVRQFLSRHVPSCSASLEDKLVWIREEEMANFQELASTQNSWSGPTFDETKPLKTRNRRKEHKQGRAKRKKSIALILPSLGEDCTLSEGVTQNR